MAANTIVVVVVMGFYEYYRRNHILDKPTSFSEMFRPVDKWGPAVPNVDAANAANNGGGGFDNEAYHGHGGNIEPLSYSNSGHM